MNPDKDLIKTLKFRIDELEQRLEMRDKQLVEQRKRADLAESERDRLKTIATNAIESENITVEKLTLTEIDLDLERQQRQKTESLLEIEKNLVSVLEDVIKATAKLREQA